MTILTLITAMILIILQALQIKRQKRTIKMLAGPRPQAWKPEFQAMEARHNAFVSKLQQLVQEQDLS